MEAVPNGVGFFAGGTIFCLFGLIGLAATVFWIWMLIDALTRLPPGSEKIVWVLVIIFTHWIGALIYFFVARTKTV